MKIVLFCIYEVTYWSIRWKKHLQWHARYTLLINDYWWPCKLEGRGFELFTLTVRQSLMAFKAGTLAQSISFALHKLMLLNIENSAPYADDSNISLKQVNSDLIACHIRSEKLFNCDTEQRHLKKLHTRSQALQSQTLSRRPAIYLFDLTEYHIRWIKCILFLFDIWLYLFDPYHLIEWCAWCSNWQLIAPLLSATVSPILFDAELLCRCDWTCWLSWFCTTFLCLSLPILHSGQENKGKVWVLVVLVHSCCDEHSRLTSCCWIISEYYSQGWDVSLLMTSTAASVTYQIANCLAESVS